MLRKVRFLVVSMHREKPPTTTIMKTEHTNKYQVTYKVGQVGIMTARFKMRQGDKLTITGFTPSGRYMHTENERGKKYTFSTDSLCLRGSHMGNTGIRFN